MKIKINILPDKQKEKRELERKIGTILRFSSSVIFVLLVLSAVLFSAQVVLGIYYDSAKKTSRNNQNQPSRDVENTEKLFSDVNLVTKNIKSTSGEIPRWSRVLKKISDITPNEVRITLIHVEKEHMKISGFSKSREAFLEFQDKINSEGLQNLVSPVANLVSPSDFDFEVEVDVDKDYLNQP
jgi:Tfp pilus assembly protein PilN